MSNIYKRSGIGDKKIKLTQESFKNTNNKWLKGQVNNLDSVFSVNIPEETKTISESVVVERPKTIGINLFASGINNIDANIDLFSFTENNLSLKYIKVRALKIKPDMMKNLDQNYSGKLVAFDVKVDIPTETVPEKIEEEKTEDITPVAIEAGTVESDPIEFPPLGTFVKEQPRIDEVIVPEFNENIPSETIETQLMPIEETIEENNDNIQNSEEEKELTISPAIHYSENNIPSGRLFVDEEAKDDYKEETIVVPERKEEEPIMNEVISIPSEEIKQSEIESYDSMTNDFLESLRKLRNEANSLKAKAAQTSEDAEKVKEDAKNKAEIIKSLVEKETAKIKREMEESQQIIDKNEEEIAKSEKEIAEYTKTQSELESILGVKAD